jgi:hypothetical protein
MRSMRLAALAVAMTLAFSGLALARDHNDHYKDKHVDHHHDSNHAWTAGGKARGNANGNTSAGNREHRNDDYYGGGQVYNRYPNGYPGGGQVYSRYPNGYPGGYPNGGYGYPGSGNGRGGYGNGGSSGAGYNQGLQDGSYQARKDVAQGKPFNPNPRGASHSDHGYSSSMGDKYAYQASYNQGYHSGYQSSYGGRGGNRGWGF